ncbi:MAG: response regulator [Parvibaculum sp.]|uniref:response regulator n=1 Tax=Parvibaculum sp. TaxID=2024848 RepID=UPI003C759AA0
MLMGNEGQGRSLTRQFGLKFVALALLLALCQLSLEYLHAKRELLDHLADRAAMLSGNLLMHAEREPSFSLPDAIRHVNWQTRYFSDLVGVYFVDPQGRLVDKAMRPGEMIDAAILKSPAVRDGVATSMESRTGRNIGLSGGNPAFWLHVTYVAPLGLDALFVVDQGVSRERIAGPIVSALAARSALFLALLAAFYWLVQSSVLRPISRLGDALARSGAGGALDLSSELPPNEIGALAKRVDELLLSLDGCMERNEVLLQAIERLDAGVLIATDEGRIVWASAGFERMTGFSRAEMESRSLDNIYSRHCKPIGALSALRQAVRFNHGYKVETVDHASNGRDFWASIEVHPIAEAAGKHGKFIVIEYDISRARKLKAELDESRSFLRARTDDLQQANTELAARRTSDTQADAEPAAKQEGRATAAQVAGATSLDVLLAEDQPVNQKLMIAVMERLGHHLTIANNGIEALRLLERQTFDVVLMDIQMPELDGINATKLIRSADEAWRNVPIVALTAHAAESQRETYLSAGMDGFVAKPFKIDLLIAEMTRVVATSRADNPQGPGNALSDMLDEIDGLIG